MLNDILSTDWNKNAIQVFRKGSEKMELMQKSGKYKKRDAYLKSLKTGEEEEWSAFDDDDDGDWDE